MKYTTKKRIKLTISLISIPIIIFLISFFVHDLFLASYVKSETLRIAAWYREKIYAKIEKDTLTENERALLWTLANLDDIKKINTSDLLQFIRVFYIMIAIFLSIFSAIITKWYMSNTDNIIISDNPEGGMKK